MRVLITGSTAQQCNPTNHQRASNFTGLLAELFEKSGVSVVWQEPSLSLSKEDYRSFDHILVGLASPLQIGSNRLYGALGIISDLWDDPRLTLFIDQPDPNKITRGLASVARNPSSLTKEFFSGRRDFDLVQQPKYRLKVLNACGLLATKDWPTTLVPALPWSTEAQFQEDLPSGARDKIVLVNVDDALLNRFGAANTKYTKTRDRRWMAERGSNKVWLKSLELFNPVLSLRADYRMDLNLYLPDRLSTSTGLLHAPTRKNKTWWSPKVAIALSQKTPVFTAWQHSISLGPEWAVLPSVYEKMPEDEQKDIASKQVESFRKETPTSTQTAYKLTRILGGG